MFDCWKSPSSIPYFHAFGGMYWRKRQLPRNVSGCSSTVEFAPGIETSWNVLFHISDTFLISYNLSGDLICLLSPALSNVITRKISWNLFRAKIALKIDLPSFWFYNLLTVSPTDFYTPRCRRVSINYLSSSIPSCLYLFLRFQVSFHIRKCANF